MPRPWGGCVCTFELYSHKLRNLVPLLSVVLALCATDESDKLTPTKVEALTAVQIRVAAAGESHSLVMAEDGRVYEFGFQDTSRLDDDDDDWQGDDEDQIPPPTHPRGEPKLIEERCLHNGNDTGRSGELFKDLRATGIAAGWGTSAFRSAAGLAASGGHWTAMEVEFELETWPAEGEDDGGGVAADPNYDPNAPLPIFNYVEEANELEEDEEDEGDEGDEE